MLVEIKNKVVGQADKDISIPNLAIEILNEEITVSNLIKETVSEAIDHISQNLGYDVSQAQTALNRQYLSDADIQEQAQKGEVKLTQENDSEQEYISKAQEIKKARQAFDNGVYIIIVDGQQADSLDQVLHLTPTSKVSFIRITPLVGG